MWNVPRPTNQSRVSQADKFHVKLMTLSRDHAVSSKRTYTQEYERKKEHLKIDVQQQMHRMENHKKLILGDLKTVMDIDVDKHKNLVSREILQDQINKLQKPLQDLQKALAAETQEERTNMSAARQLRDHLNKFKAMGVDLSTAKDEQSTSSKS